MTYKLSLRLMVGLLLSLAASASQAHTGHGTSGFYEGITHPFGLDHLLAMIAVGIWSVSALPNNKAWWGPTTFMFSLIASAAMGANGITVPFLENLISLSVILFGVMLFVARFKLPTLIGLALVAIAGSLHGLAHGAESPETGFAMYAVGFLTTTATLHFGGVIAGLSIKRYVPNKASLINATLGVLFGGAGVYLLSQL